MEVCHKRKQVFSYKAGNPSVCCVLEGRPFIVKTDHHSLQLLQKFRDGDACLMTWSLSLQPYQFTMEHCKGLDNTNANGLSCVKQKRQHLMQEKGEECHRFQLLPTVYSLRVSIVD